MVEDVLEVQVDLDAASHLPNPEAVARFRDARVIPLTVVIRNVGTSELIVGSARIAVELSDGRHLRAILPSAVDERLPTPSAPAPDSPASKSDTSSSEGLAAGGGASSSEQSPPETPGDTGKPGEAPPPATPEATLTEEAAPPSKAWETTKDYAKGIGGSFLAGMALWPAFALAAALVFTSPIWGPALLISRHVKKKSEELAAAQKERTFALERHDDVHLAKSEAAGGLLYFATEGDLPATLSTATLIVPVRRADTGEEHSVRLPLGKVE